MHEALEGQHLTDTRFYNFLMGAKIELTHILTSF